MKTTRIFLVCMLMGLLVAGCSQEPDMTTPEAQVAYDKNGTEALGPPSISIAAGSGFAIGGTGMVGIDTGNFDVTVPDDATVQQVLLYWVGGTTSDMGDDNITVNGTPVAGTQIHQDPTNFFGAYDFYSYRADVTSEDWVVAGVNSFEITDFDFDFTGGGLDENHGAGILVIYDDGTMADISLVDGLDCAYFDFVDPLDRTVPQTFYFAAEDQDRVADLAIFAGSVGTNRPNQVKVTTIAGDVFYDDELGDHEGALFDAHPMEVDIPAGATELTVELISTPSASPQGASLTWIGCGLSVPVTERYCIGDYVWYDENRDGCQDTDEMGAEGVEVNLWVGCPPQEVIATTVTGSMGEYQFCELLPGEYTVQFVAPDGYYFCDPFSDGCDETGDSNANADGISDCVTIVDADDWTIDAALCMPREGCTLTIGFWKTHAGLGNGNQDDVLSQYLPIWLGDDTGAKSLGVTTNTMAVDVLKQNTYGDPSNGITKLYAQMLAAKLNVASGASDGDIGGYLDDADAFLAEYDYTDWDDLSDEMKDDVMMWHRNFDLYNNGEIGPGHCYDDDDDDDDDMDMFK